MSLPFYFTDTPCKREPFSSSLPRQGGAINPGTRTVGCTRFSADSTGPVVPVHVVEVGEIGFAFAPETQLGAGWGIWVVSSSTAELVTDG